MGEKLLDKVAVVTGAGSGIGRSSAITFAREGAKVVIADIDPAGGEETVQIIKRSGGEAVFIKTDVSKSGEVELLVKKTIEHYKRLDCAHNNAGIYNPEPPIHDLPEDYWDRVMNVNLKSIYLCMKYELQHMVTQGYGAIVNTSSMEGLIGVKNMAAYVTSKHGINGLTKVAALEYARAGIRVNAVCPGLTLTPQVERDMKAGFKIVDQIAEDTPMGRLAKVEEIADVVVWLCSNASFVTGLCMPVDGGFTAT
jgi:NAD(P)-dependent dehydrogenase (short-subunit alcohol dehydrogenase family)